MKLHISRGGGSYTEYVRCLGGWQRRERRYRGYGERCWSAFHPSDDARRLADEL